MSTDMSVSEKLRLSALLDAITDPAQPFSADMADEIETILKGVRRNRLCFDISLSHTQAPSRGYAAGVGDLRIDGPSKLLRMRGADPEIRSGNWIVNKQGRRRYWFRHLGDVMSFLNRGQFFQLRHCRGAWRLYVHSPVTIRLLGISLTFGPVFKETRAAR